MKKYKKSRISKINPKNKMETKIVSYVKDKNVGLDQKKGKTG